jgi:hypothetical protein
MPLVLLILLYLGATERDRVGQENSKSAPQLHPNFSVWFCADRRSIERSRGLLYIEQQIDAKVEWEDEARKAEGLALKARREKSRKGRYIT